MTTKTYVNKLKRATDPEKAKIIFNKLLIQLSSSTILLDFLNGKVDIMFDDVINEILNSQRKK